MKRRRRLGPAERVGNESGSVRPPMTTQRRDGQSAVRRRIRTPQADSAGRRSAGLRGGSGTYAVKDVAAGAVVSQHGLRWRDDANADRRIDCVAERRAVTADVVDPGPGSMAMSRVCHGAQGKAQHQQRQCLAQPGQRAIFETQVHLERELKALPYGDQVFRSRAKEDRDEESEIWPRCAAMNRCSLNLCVAATGSRRAQTRWQSRSCHKKFIQELLRCDDDRFGSLPEIHCESLLLSRAITLLRFPCRVR